MPGRYCLSGSCSYICMHLFECIAIPKQDSLPVGRQGLRTWLFVLAVHSPSYKGVPRDLAVRLLPSPSFTVRVPHRERLGGGCFVFRCSFPLYKGGQGDLAVRLLPSPSLTVPHASSGERAGRGWLFCIRLLPSPSERAGRGGCFVLAVTLSFGEGRERLADLYWLLPSPLERAGRGWLFCIGCYPLLPRPTASRRRGRGQGEDVFAHLSWISIIM